MTLTLTELALLREAEAVKDLAKQRDILSEALGDSDVAMQGLTLRAVLDRRSPEVHREVFRQLHKLTLKITARLFAISARAHGANEFYLLQLLLLVVSDFLL